MAKRFKVSATARMNPLILLLLPLVLSTAWSQVTKPASEDSIQTAIEAVLADFDAKKNNEALAKLEALQKQVPDDPLVLNLIGSAYTRKKDYLAADAYFRKAVKKSPGYFPALYNIGEILFWKKKYTEAREHFQAMRSTDTGNELLQFKIVLCDLGLKETERAAKVMNAIKYPGNSPAWYYAQAAYENHLGHKKKAREYVAGAKYIFGPKTALFDETLEAAGINLH